MKLSLKRIGILSLGKFMATVASIFGIIGFVVYLVLFLIGQFVTHQDMGLFLISGIVTIIAYILGSFVLGCIAAFFYNIALGLSGGVELNFKEEADDMAVRRFKDKNML